LFNIKRSLKGPFYVLKIFLINLFFFNAHFIIQVSINQYTAAMFAGDDFFVLAYLALALGGYYIKAAAA
jgi:hypothetical protein